MQSTPTTSPRKNVFALALAFMTWASIAIQYYLGTGTAINFFSFFTIQCNLLVAVSLTISTLSPNSGPGKFFSGLSVQSAIALYIFIVCLVYNLVLRGMFELTGWHWFVDNMLHVVIPVLYILYWLYFRSAGTLHWRDSLYWIIFPFLYLSYSLYRGSIIAWYPYPFLNVMDLGYPVVFTNIAMIIVVFMVAGAGLIYVTRVSYRNATVPR